MYSHIKVGEMLKQQYPQLSITSLKKEISLFRNELRSQLGLPLRGATTRTYLNEIIVTKPKKDFDNAIALIDNLYNNGNNDEASNLSTETIELATIAFIKCEISQEDNQKLKNKLFLVKTKQTTIQSKKKNYDLIDKNIRKVNL